MRGLRGIAVVRTMLDKLSFKDLFIIEFEVHATQIGALTNHSEPGQWTSPQINSGILAAW
jgi:hypothetical protein